MTRLRDLTNQYFGRWYVVERDTRTDSRGNAYWVCVYNCGTFRSVMTGNLTRGLSTSCGCPTENSKIKYSTQRSWKPEYRAWNDMKYRCTNPKSHQYKWYGGRGIKVCEEWVDDFDGFYDYIGPRPDGCSLDRINGNGNYEPGNVRWADRVVQANNRR